MATVKVSFGSAMAAGAPVFPTKSREAETITSSASSQQTTATARSNEYIHVTASGGAVHVQIGSNPTAASTSDWLLTDGETRTFGAAKEGDKVAVIDA